MKYAHRQHGFTLIEIITVIFVIGMAVGVITLAVGGDRSNDRLREEAETLLMQTMFVSEQAILKGETFGLFVEERPAEEFGSENQWCYFWQRVREGLWQPAQELEPHCLESGIGISFVLDDEDWEYDPEVKHPEPVIGFYPSGDASAVAEIELYVSSAGVERIEPERFELTLAGEFIWVSEKERLDERKR